jgi:hypothetical protein
MCTLHEMHAVKQEVEHVIKERPRSLGLEVPGCASVHVSQTPKRVFAICTDFNFGNYTEPTNDRYKSKMYPCKSSFLCEWLLAKLRLTKILPGIMHLQINDLALLISLASAMAPKRMGSIVPSSFKEGCTSLGTQSFTHAPTSFPRAGGSRDRSLLSHDTKRD